jgi:hypothetical protein
MTCAGHKSAIRPWSPARLCGACAHYSLEADEVLPGFEGGTCRSFHAVSIGHTDTRVQSEPWDGRKHSGGSR